MVGHGEKHWDFLCLRESDLLVHIEWQITTQLWSSFLLFDRAGSLSHRRAWWLVLGLHALWGRKPTGTSRIAKLGACGSLVCVAAGSWHWVSSWGCLLGSKSSRLELSGAHKAAEALVSTCVGVWASKSHSNCCRHRGPKPAGSKSSGACLPGVGFQEPKELQQSQENKACGQGDPWGLLAGVGFWERSECSTVVLPAQGNQVWSPEFLCVLGSRTCRWMPSNGAWNHVAISGVRDLECWAGRHSSLFSCG
jgi:hypothetical protein